MSKINKVGNRRILWCLMQNDHVLSRSLDYGNLHGTLIAVTSSRSDWSIRGFPDSVVSPFLYVTGSSNVENCFIDLTEKVLIVSFALSVECSGFWIEVCQTKSGFTPSWLAGGRPEEHGQPGPAWDCMGLLSTWSHHCDKKWHCIRLCTMRQFRHIIRLSEVLFRASKGSRPGLEWWFCKFGIKQAWPILPTWVFCILILSNIPLGLLSPGAPEGDRSALPRPLPRTIPRPRPLPAGPAVSDTNCLNTLDSCKMKQWVLATDYCTSNVLFTTKIDGVTCSCAGDFQALVHIFLRQLVHLLNST